MPAHFRQRVTRLLHRFGLRHRGWGDWQNLAVPEQDARYQRILSWLAGEGRSKAILDLGCGEAVLLEKARAADATRPSRYLGIELNVEAVRGARRRIQSPDREEVLAGDITDLSLLGDETFDVVVFNEVLYYLSDPGSRAVELMRKCEERLKPGGLFVVSVFHNRTNPKPANELVWERVNAAYHDFGLASEYVAKNDVSGWHIGLYRPRSGSR